LLRLLSVRSLHAHPRTDCLRIPRLPGEPHLQPVIGGVAYVSVRGELPDEPVLGGLVELFPPLPEGKVLVSCQQHVAPPVVIEAENTSHVPFPRKSATTSLPSTNQYVSVSPFN